MLKATDGFSSTNLIGVGSYRFVCKGNLNKEILLQMANKVLNLPCHGASASKSFNPEYENLINTGHWNLVKILARSLGDDYQGNEFKAFSLWFYG